MREGPLSCWNPSKPVLVLEALVYRLQGLIEVLPLALADQDPQSTSRYQEVTMSDLWRRAGIGLWC